MHHTDAAGLLFFGHQFALMHEAYESFFESIGIPFRDLLQKENFFLPIVHAEADYKKPLFVGDPLQITVTIDQIGHTSFMLAYQLHRDSELVGLGKTIHVTVHKTTRKKSPVPSHLREILTKAA
jgi:YbgC/YbaW family acyl-CoA thioester hydrolase